MTQRISIDPNPPLAGRSATISYDFEGSGLSFTELQVSHVGSDETSSHEVTPSNPSVTITLPDGAQQITIVDLHGTSPNLVVAVSGGAEAFA